MARLSRIAGLLCALLASSWPVRAAPPAADLSPQAVVQAFHAALSNEQTAAALALLTEDLQVYEKGYVDFDRRAYAEQHLPADMALAAAVRRSTARVTSGQTGSALGASAWVLSEFQLQGEYRGKRVDSRGTETMLLRRTEAGWRIYHIHWSSHPRTPPG